MNNIIEISNLVKNFGDVQAVKNLSFRVREGELFAYAEWSLNAVLIK